MCLPTALGQSADLPTEIHCLKLIRSLLLNVEVFWCPWKEHSRAAEVCMSASACSNVRRAVTMSAASLHCLRDMCCQRNVVLWTYTWLRASVLASVSSVMSWKRRPCNSLNWRHKQNELVVKRLSEAYAHCQIVPCLWRCLTGILVTIQVSSFWARTAFRLPEFRTSLLSVSYRQRHPEALPHFCDIPILWEKCRNC